jgi:hypothetical protein
MASSPIVIAASPIVTASEAKQSSLVLERPGLLRRDAPRNDGHVDWIER